MTEKVELEEFILSKEYCLSIQGGKRRVDKVDTNGDGRWNIERVYRRDGTLKKIVARYFHFIRIHLKPQHFFEVFLSFSNMYKYVFFLFFSFSFGQEYSNKITELEIKNFFENNISTGNKTEWGYTLVHSDSVVLKKTVFELQANTFKSSGLYIATDDDDPKKVGFKGLYAMDLIEIKKYSHLTFYNQYITLLEKAKIKGVSLVGFYVLDDSNNLESKDLFDKPIPQNITPVIFGKIVNSKSKELIPFVNIGVFEKNIGTTTDNNGKFSLALPKSMLDNKLTISCIGFKTKILNIRNLLIDNEVLIKLEELPYFLEEVVLTAENKTKTKILGVRKANSNHSGFVYGKGAGAEISRLIRNNKKIRVKSISVFIGNNRNEVFVLRGNIYSYSKNSFVPDKNLLKKQMIKSSNIKSGWLTFELEDYLIVNSSFFVAFEWINEDVKNPMIAFNNSKISKNWSYQRSVSQGKWVKSQDFDWAIKCKVVVFK